MEVSDIVKITLSKIVKDTDTGKRELEEVEFIDIPRQLSTYLLWVQGLIESNPALASSLSNGIACSELPILRIYFDENNLPPGAADTLRAHGLKRLSRCPDDSLFARAVFDPHPPDEIFQTLNQAFLDASKKFTQEAKQIFRRACEDIELNPLVYKAIEPMITWRLEL